MFNKLKQFKDMREQAKNLQNELSKESISASSSGVNLTLDGNLAMTQLSIGIEMMSPDKQKKLEDAIKDAYSDALKKIQRKMAMKMKEMGGLPNIPGLN
jgi:DNA-binding YbaB/EbfC family protein